MDKDLLKIKLLFDCPEDVESSFELYVASLEKALASMIPEEVLHKAPDPSDSEAVTSFFNKIGKELPLIATSFGESAPYIVSLRFLAYSQFTHGMGRFVSDTTSRWLVPGKQLPLVSVNSMAFEFLRYPGIGFFFHEILARIDSEADLKTVKENLDGLMREIKLNILTVHHARRIVGQKKLTLDQKKMIIQENVSSLLGRQHNKNDETIYDNAHQLLIKILADQKVSQINETITPLLELRPQIFERDVFIEVQDALELFHDEFIATRDPKYMRRIVSYMYLFKKSVSNLNLLHPDQRHLSYKLLKTRANDDGRHVLGVVLSLNLLRETEIFEKRNLLKALQSILPYLRMVPNSYVDARKTNSVRNFFIEVQKEDGQPFTPREISSIRTKLFTEVKTRIESIINPIFMQKNEEEIMRNILILSNQLKYVQDIPQATITFLKQSDHTLSFIVVLVRLLRFEDLPLKLLFAKHTDSIHIENHEVKAMGLLRKKYAKEANVFEVHVKKERFLREDFSLDLYEARRMVYNSLSNILGDIRDYNGGMISKQNEALGELTKLLLQEEIKNDFLIENYFYSLNPVYMQSVHSTHILKKQFMMLLQASEHDYTQQPYFMQVQIVDNFFILMLGSMTPSFKDVINENLEKLSLDKTNLTTSFLNNHDVLCLGYLYRFNHPKDYEQIIVNVTESVKGWKKTLKSDQTFDPVTVHLSQAGK